VQSSRTIGVLASLVAVAALAAACSSPSGPACVGSVSEALRVCQGPNVVSGIDVSSYQGNVDFARVAAAGNGFVFLRLSSGQNVDTKFQANWQAAKAAGLVRGAYQYFWPGRDPDAQVDVMVQTLKAAGYTRDDLPPVLDLETLDGQPVAAVVAYAQHWLRRVEDELHVRPLVYTANFMSNVTQTYFSSYPLWVANYGVTCPLMPTGWTKWVFWQSSDSGRVDGVVGNVDLDTFDGTMADLLAFARGSHLVGPSDAGPISDAGPRDAALSFDAEVPPPRPKPVLPNVTRPELVPDVPCP
jgi:lysozyme